MPFYIENVETGLVLDIPWSSNEPHTELIMFKRNGQPNQQWTYQSGMIISELNGLVLDVNEETGRVIMYPQHGGTNQLWAFDEDQTIRSGNGKVLDVEEKEKTPGAKIIAFPNNGQTNQKFRRVEC